MNNIEPTNVIGVFQGGGVKVSAYVGAYKACSENNINFVRVAGTSGGAIIASLIAAGYDYVELEALIKPLNFETLTSPSIRIPNFKMIKLGRLKRIILGNVKELKPLIKAYENYGFRSLSPLEDWLNKLFMAKLNINEKRLVRFRDLEMPLMIISVDLVEGNYKIFSKEKTPDESIAQAVRASASIPIVFQPLVENSEVLVDGGIVSNLPISIVQKELFKKREKNVPIVAFGIKNVLLPGAGFPWSQEDYINSLINIVSDGNVEIQKLNLPANTHLINIKLKDVKPTDFELTLEKKEELILCGYTTTKEYFQLIENVSTNNSAPHPKVFHGREEIFTLIQNSIAIAKKNIIFFLDELSEKIAYSLVLTLTIAIIRKTKISFVIFPKIDEDLNRSSLKLLTQIGVTVIKKSSTEKIPFKGFIIDSSKIALIDSSEEDENNYCVVYDKWSDKQIFHIFLNIANQFQEEIQRNENGYQPELVVTKNEEIQQLYRRIIFYEQEDVAIAPESINPYKTIPHTKFVKEFKINQLKYFRKYLKSAGFGIYQPLSIKLKNGSLSLINPPVLELRSDGNYHIVEGHNRLYYSRLIKETSIEVIVVTNVKDQMPSQAYQWSAVEILTSKADEDETNKDNIQEFLRRIESSTHIREEWND